MVHSTITTRISEGFASTVRGTSDDVSPIAGQDTATAGVDTNTAKAALRIVLLTAA
jgi:hypothetical protein